MASAIFPGSASVWWTSVVREWSAYSRRPAARRLPHHPPAPVHAAAEMGHALAIDVGLDEEAAGRVVFHIGARRGPHLDDAPGDLEHEAVIQNPLAAGVDGFEDGRGDPAGVLLPVSDCAGGGQLQADLFV